MTRKKRSDAATKETPTVTDPVKEQTLEALAKQLMPTLEDLEGAVNLAVDATEACKGDNGIDDSPEYFYEEACLDRIRRLVFVMTGVVSPLDVNLKRGACDKLGPAAVQLEDNLVVCYPLDNSGGSEGMERWAVIRSVTLIPTKNVVRGPI
jgi:hypothetical protein